MMPFRSERVSAMKATISTQNKGQPKDLHKGLNVGTLVQMFTSVLFLGLGEIRWLASIA